MNYACYAYRDFERWTLDYFWFEYEFFAIAESVIRCFLFYTCLSSMIWSKLKINSIKYSTKPSAKKKQKNTLILINKWQAAAQTFFGIIIQISRRSQFILNYDSVDFRFGIAVSDGDFFDYMEFVLTIFTPSI